MLKIDNVYLLIFLSGLVGGFGHCIWMCGPLVGTFTVSLGLHPLKRLGPHLQYHAGRLLCYGFIGAMLGFTGSFFLAFRGLQWFQGVALFLAGLLMMIMGIFTIFPLSGQTLKLLLRFRPLLLLVLRHGGPFPLGLLNGFLPCGLSYSAFLAASGLGATEGAPLLGLVKGLVLLLLFGLGTMPGLLILSWASLKSVTLLRGRFYRLAGILMGLSGLIFVIRALKG